MADDIIYVLTNEAMPGYVKVGRTDKSVAERIRGLDNTSVPLPFECYYAARVEDAEKVERLVHDAFADNRVRRGREFFTIDPERVKSAIKIGEIEDLTPSEDELVETSEDKAALEGARKRRKSATLGMLGIEPGEILTFSKDAGITCTVLDDRKVDYEGETMSVSKSAHVVLLGMGYEWTTANGWAFWQYKGRTLSDLWLEAQGGN